MSDLDKVLCFARHVVEQDGAEAEGEDVYKVQAALASIIRAENELKDLRQANAIVDGIRKMLKDLS